MTQITVFANQKGGVGKTTTCVNVAAFLAHLGHPVVLIDLDPQANASSGVGVDKNTVEDGTYSVLTGQKKISDVLRGTAVPNLRVCPASPALVGAEVELVSVDQREFQLKFQVGEFVRQNPNARVLIDCPPSLGLLTLNALTAAQQLLIPLQCEFYALEGLAQLTTTVQLVQQGLNPALEVGGVIFTMVDPRSNLTSQVIDETRKFFGEKVFKTMIPRSIRLAEAPGHGKPILLYDPHSKGADAYGKLAAEILVREQTSKEVIQR